MEERKRVVLPKKKQEPVWWMIASKMLSVELLSRLELVFPYPLHFLANIVSNSGHHITSRAIRQAIAVRTEKMAPLVITAASIGCERLSFNIHPLSGPELSGERCVPSLLWFPDNDIEKFCDNIGKAMISFSCLSRTFLRVRQSKRMVQADVEKATREKSGRRVHTSAVSVFERNYQPIGLPAILSIGMALDMKEVVIFDITNEASGTG